MQIHRIHHPYTVSILLVKVPMDIAVILRSYIHTRTLQFTEDVLGSEPGEGLIAGVSKLQGRVQPKFCLIYPVRSIKTNNQEGMP